MFGRTKTSLNKDIEHLQNAVSAHIAAMKENLKKELKDELKKELIEELKKEMKEEMKAVYQRYELEKEKNRKLMNLLEESKQISSQLETKIHILSSEADSTLNEFAAKGIRQCDVQKCVLYMLKLVDGRGFYD